jgi:hypothetical protein
VTCNGVIQNAPEGAAILARRGARLTLEPCFGTLRQCADVDSLALLEQDLSDKRQNEKNDCLLLFVSAPAFHERANTHKAPAQSSTAWLTISAALCSAACARNSGQLHGRNSLAGKRLPAPLKEPRRPHFACSAQQ